jgi:MmyB-like transcription regulator ligand binding domain
MKIAQALDVPLRDRNVLLLSAGYAPAYSQAAWNSGQMQSVTRALERILRQNEPYPALVMDRYWNVLMTNESTAQEVFSLPPITRRKGRNRTVVLAHPFFWRLPVVRPPGFF